MKKILILFAALLFTALTFAQAHPEPAKSEPAKASETKTEDQAAGHETAAVEGEHASKEGAAQEEDQHTKLTQSAVVKKLAGMLGVTPKTAYWIFVIINFAILAGGFLYMGRSSVPQIFRGRTTTIQKSMEDARKASADAAARITEIEGRLSKLDQEISGMRAQAETEAKAEEDRLRAATEEEKRKIVQSAEQEIAAAANNARRELKNLAAELAVSLAEKKIAVSDETDRVLVRDFASHLDGKGRS